MALHMSGGYAARASVLKGPTSPFFLTGDMCTCWHFTTGPSEKPLELNKGKFALVKEVTVCAFVIMRVGFGVGEP